MRKLKGGVGKGGADTRAMVLIRVRVDGVDLTGLSLFALDGETGVFAAHALSAEWLDVHKTKHEHTEENGWSFAND